jgi:hypothetical protein
MGGIGRLGHAMTGESSPFGTGSLDPAVDMRIDEK